MDVIALARKRFKQAIDAESENRSKELDDLKFLAASPDDNFQWPETILKQRMDPSQEGGARPCLTINKLPQHHRQVTNELRMNRPTIKVQPVDDRGDIEVADVFNGIIRHIQVASEADLAYDTAADAQVAHGVGYFRIYTQFTDEMSFDQDIVIAPVPDRFKVYLDPIGILEHPAGRKCRWGFIIEDLPKEEYEAQYGEHPIDWNDAAIGDQEQWFPNKETVRIAEYFEIEESEKTLCLWPDGSTSIKEDGKLPYGVVAGMMPVKERKTKIPRCIWRKISGQKELDKREMPTKYLPIIRVVGNQWIIEGKAIVSGIVRNAKDAQRMYNYHATKEVEVTALQPIAPITAMVEQIEGHEDKYKKANHVPLSFLPYNAVVDESTGAIVNVAPPARIAPPMASAAVIQAKLAASDDIKATTGQYDASLGQRSNETSGKAIQTRQRESDVGTFHYIDNHARALRYAGTILVDMIPKIYDTKRVARIIGEDGEPDHVMVDPKLPQAVQPVKDQAGKEIGKIYNLGVGRYDVVVNVGPSFTTRRQEAAEFLTSAVQSAKDPATASVLAYLAMKNQDWAGAEEAVSMLKKLLPPGMVEEEGEAEIPAEVAQMVEQLKAGIGNLQGQLDAAKGALSERDATLKDLEGQIKGKNVDALAKMYEADKKALAEITKAQADVITARADALLAAQQSPENGDLQGLVAALTATITEMQGKIDALAASSAAIAEQLQAFEISARIPVAA